jgi:putative ABC transport system ATP-binding protein
VAARNLCRQYGSGEAATVALDNLDIEFAPGRFAAVMGASGSGKSTLLHCLAGLDRPTSGRVVLDGVDLTTLNDRRLTQLRREKVGFVFQSFNLLPVLSAKENILLPLSVAHGQVDNDWFDQLISMMGIAGRLAHRPAELSGGQQQRVAVARALITRPAVVFADEPTGNLDSKASAQVLNLLRQAVDELGQTVVMVTHDPRAASFADRLVLLADGRLVHDGEVSSTDGIVSLLKEVG